MIAVRKSRVITLSQARVFGLVQVRLNAVHPSPTRRPRFIEKFRPDRSRFESHHRTAIVSAHSLQIDGRIPSRCKSLFAVNSFEASIVFKNATTNMKDCDEAPTRVYSGIAKVEDEYSC